MMHPLMVDLKGKLVVIVGGGEIGYRKARGLLESGAAITVVAKELVVAFESIASEIHIELRAFRIEDIHQAFLVIAATNERTINSQIGSYCQDHHILCNVVDNPMLSSFTTPAYIRRGDLVLSVSTNGKSPYLAKKIRQQLEEKYDESYCEYLMVLGRLRECILEAVKDEKEKKKLLAHVITVDYEKLKVYENEGLKAIQEATQIE